MSIILAALLAMQSGPACAAAGRSVDQDPAGLNVRAAPSANARIVGRLYSVEEPEAHHGGWPPRYGPIFCDPRRAGRLGADRRRRGGSRGRRWRGAAQLYRARLGLGQSCRGDDRHGGDGRSGPAGLFPARFRGRQSPIRTGSPISSRCSARCAARPASSPAAALGSSSTISAWAGSAATAAGAISPRATASRPAPGSAAARRGNSS